MRYSILAIHTVLLFLVLPLHAGTPTVSFVTFGDWGTGTAPQKRVANAVQQYCTTQHCQFVLTLGDNFYENGVRSTSDPKWHTYYKTIYGPLKIPFYAILGNHDERGNVKAQIDYSKIEPSWHMPGRYYSVSFPENSTSPVLEIFVINNGDRQFEPDEKEWLRNALSKSRARWKLLAIHIPIISNGKHGDNDSKINDQLVPIICDKIDVVLSGHDHNFAHLRGVWKGCTIDQLIVGTGGRYLYSTNDKDPRALASGAIFGFGWIEATDKQLQFKMIKDNGITFYSTEWKK